MITTPVQMICASCLRCGHASTIPAETLERYGHGPNVTLAYMSRFVVCQFCGSHAVKLERRDARSALAFVRAAGSRR